MATTAGRKRKTSPEADVPDTKPNNTAPKSTKKAPSKRRKTDELSGPGDDKNSKGKKIRVNWDIALAEAIVTAIQEKESIKKKLYPPPGPNASTADGGGNTKTVAHWEICVEVFSDHPLYKEAFADALNADEKSRKTLRDSWCGGIKSQLRRMEQVTATIRKEMGQTGMGLTSADQVNTDADSPVSNAWQKYGAKFPWFFRFRDIVGERPNIVLTGIGNSATEIDLDFDLPEDIASSEAPATSDYDADLADNDDVKEGDGDSDVEHDQSQQPEGESTVLDMVESKGEGELGKKGEPKKPGNTKPSKAVEKASTTLTKKTGPRKSESKPAVAPLKTGKKGKMDEFAEIVKVEEVTRQKELELETLKMQEQSKKYQMMESMAKMRHEGKMKRLELKTELRRQELEYKKMKLAGAGVGMAGMSMMGTPAASGSSTTLDYQQLQPIGESSNISGLCLDGNVDMSYFDN
ncbi:hypothetical protein V5O48_018660 [Marasmius crinis-equi]|uniref:No apical meristem-associated C-terminal domain-containing protein n=1 Tax=Marasmius crinis-equi TaxID=585013 RepID=A0ABR3EKM1_9AGAR